jgi:hypothetical protein
VKLCGEILCLHHRRRSHAIHYREGGGHRIACSSISFKSTILIRTMYNFSKNHCNAWLNGSSPPPRPFMARTCISPSCLVSLWNYSVGDSSVYQPQWVSQSRFPLPLLRLAHSSARYVVYVLWLRECKSLFLSTRGNAWSVRIR